MARVSPSLLIGNSGEDAIELLCTAIVAEDVMLASYQFTWMKDDTPIDLSNDRIVVRMWIRSLYIDVYNIICITWICYTLHNQLYRSPIITTHHYLPSKPLILMLHWIMMFTVAK